MSKRPGDPGYAPGWCIHYRAPSGFGAGGKGHDTCEAGVSYSQFQGMKFAVRPCFLDKHGQSEPGALSCEHLRRPTPEEIAAHEKWADQRTKTMIVVMTAIQPWRQKHKGRSFSEMIECPACKGKLHLSIASVNGHVHAHCETEGCVSWME